MCATIPPLLSPFSFFRSSVQLERGCSPPCHAFPSRLVFLRGIRNILAIITYLDNFRRTCHFQVARTPAILFSTILVFPLTRYNRGCCSRPISCFSHKKYKTFVGKRPRKVMLETVLCSGNQPCPEYRTGK